MRIAPLCTRCLTHRQRACVGRALLVGLVVNPREARSAPSHERPHCLAFRSSQQKNRSRSQREIAPIASTLSRMNDTRQRDAMNLFLHSGLKVAVRRVAVMHQLGINVTHLMSQLPSQSSLRSPLTHALAIGITPRDGARYLHMSSNTFIAYRRRPPPHDMLLRRYPFDVHRNKLPTPERDTIIEWIKDTCPTKSGSPNDRNYLWTTKESLYAAYVQATDQPPCYRTFINIFNAMKVNIRAAYWGSFDRDAGSN
jgi:hypothetical protein